MPQVEQIIASMREQIDTVDQEILMEVAGVAQALAELRKALDEVDACLENRDIEKAAALGYGSISSGFVFLQRTLGGLQDASLHKEEIVSEVAAKVGCAYEDVLPHVNDNMQFAQPRRPEA